MIEPLESRQLLSAAAQAVFHSDAIFMHSSAATASSIQGYTPSQVRKAYGFDQVTLSGNVAGDGSGQTIAIVDAYNDPNISVDLNTFDNQFGLAPAKLKVVNQSGGSALPATDSGWAGEISLDVEWAHAIAPAADLLLVEANSATLNDLIAGVNLARHASDVSVVSMSWGGSEFFSWNGSEFSGQVQYDPTFTTPAGHEGVTFVAAAGDSGAYSGVEWPASSPNVVSVGGTSLSLQDTNGTYAGESSWSGTSGGYSQVEATPSWQQNVQNGGSRSTPDVAYDADPNTGFAVYDSLPDQGYSGWQEVGGTSAGAPQWAALLAIVDQARVLAGRGTLDGATQTLPALYNLYSAPGSDGYSTYTADFNDVIDSGGGGPFQWPWGFGFSNNAATSGYDTATGLGTPLAGGLVAALSGNTPNTPGGVGGQPGGGSSNTAIPAQLPASPIIGQVLTSPPASVIGGDSGSMRLRLTNTGDTRFTGPITVTLYASPDGLLTDASTVATVSLPKENLRAGGSKVMRIKFNYPTDIPGGSYSMIASIDATGTNTEPAQAVAAAPVMISGPFVDLAASFAAASVVVNPGHNTSVTLTVQNLGNVSANGTLGVTLYASSDQSLDTTADPMLAVIPARALHLRAGRSITLHLRFQALTGQPAGTYDVVAQLNSSTNPADANPANDVAALATAAS